MKWKEIIPNDDPIVVVVGAMAHGSVSLICCFFLSCITMEQNDHSADHDIHPLNCTCGTKVHYYFSNLKIKHEQQGKGLNMHTLVTILKFASYCLRSNNIVTLLFRQLPVRFTVSNITYYRLK